MDKNSLAYTTWNCKYYIVFAPKYRRQIIYGKIRVEIGKILRTLCERKGIEIHEALECLAPMKALAECWEEKEKAAQQLEAIINELLPAVMRIT